MKECMNAGPIKSLSSPFMHSCYSAVQHLADKINRKELIMNASIALALWLQVPANFPLVLSCELPFNSIGML